MTVEVVAVQSVPRRGQDGGGPERLIEATGVRMEPTIWVFLLLIFSLVLLVMEMLFRRVVIGFLAGWQPGGLVAIIFVRSARRRAVWGLAL